jgi:hypothetical protein
MNTMEQMDVKPSNSSQPPKEDVLSVSPWHYYDYTKTVVWNPRSRNTLVGHILQESQEKTAYNNLIIRPLSVDHHQERSFRSSKHTDR